VAWLTARVLGRFSRVCWAYNQITCQRVFAATVALFEFFQAQVGVQGWLCLA